jgi:hypothetical protein
VPAAGALLGIGRHAAYVAARAGAIPTLRLGRRIVVPVGQLAALLGTDEADVRSFADHVVSDGRTKPASPASVRSQR